VITYILLCGFPPFYDENQVEEMRKILQGEFEFVPPYFDHVSGQAKDLIKRMLVVDASKRLSAEQVLAHSWFSDIQDDDDVVPLSSVAKNLKEQQRAATRKKFRTHVGAIIAVTKTQRLLSMKQARAPT
jgi:serine/threonine protein kinase